MEYRPAHPDQYEAIRQFLSDLGWNERVRDPARFHRLMENSDRTVVAWDEGRIIGFARALCDDVSNGYISMVAVALDYRGKGVGRELVNRLVGEDRNITWVLRDGRNSAGFWRKLGFVPSQVAMEKTRTVIS
jgi:GNAT superfamily N-acetyltransferase